MRLIPLGQPDGQQAIAALEPVIAATAEAVLARRAPGPTIASVADLLCNSSEEGRDPSRPFLLAPCDLQVIKASGVTFASSLIERLIEEQARGDPARAEAVRARIVAIIGEDLRAIVPGSAAALRLKASLVEQGLWSPYLEVGIGPDAEIFTKASVLRAPDDNRLGPALEGRDRHRRSYLGGHTPSRVGTGGHRRLTGAGPEEVLGRS